ncbi:MAG TPA: Gfo/Idh/MocA family oxidoreductase [Candidatus Sulfotelmatobacter sp.]|nr:Gfo/Idh/MocA family oxidoreductase [Candidatus Sulfotelmatobacter sp.]
MRELRIGLVGFGSIARTHASVFGAMPAVGSLAFRPVLHAIVTHRPAEVAEAARAMGVDRIFATVEQALEDPSIDAFDVTSRNVDHVRDASPVLRAARPLYLEKPAGRTAAEAASLAALGSDAVPSQVALVMRYHPAVVKAHALLHLGAIGAVRHGRLQLFHGSYLDPARPSSWRLQAAIAGGGAMLDLGLHLIDLVQLFFGEPVVVNRTSRTILPVRPAEAGGTRIVDVDDWGWAELRTVGGTVLTVEASRLAYGAEGARFEFFGSEGSLTADLDVPDGLRLRRFDGQEAACWRRLAEAPEVQSLLRLLPPERLTLGPFVDMHLASLHHFLLRVSGDDPNPGYAPGLAVSAIAERIVEAVSTPGVVRELTAVSPP